MDKEGQVIQAAAQVPVPTASSAEIWTIIGSLATAAAAVAAITAIFLAIPQLRHNTKALQLQVFESVFKDIRQLDHIWIEQNFDHGMTKEQRRAWCASFFNTVEYLCFLMNKDMVREKELNEFWGTALPKWQKQFQKYVREDLITDSPDMFCEFKKRFIESPR
jgi:hypothetical protein